MKDSICHHFGFIPEASDDGENGSDGADDAGDEHDGDDNSDNYSDYDDNDDEWSCPANNPTKRKVIQRLYEPSRVFGFYKIVINIIGTSGPFGPIRTIHPIGPLGILRPLGRMCMSPSKSCRYMMMDNADDGNGDDDDDDEVDDNANR